ncbi:MAG: hypothetical protein ACRDPA_09385, partial [Solirubrobacteraceae bacterium]
MIVAIAVTIMFVSPRVADGCFSPPMHQPSRSRPAESAALLLSRRHRPDPAPKRSSRLDPPRYRNARKEITQRPTAPRSHSLRTP